MQLAEYLKKTNQSAAGFAREFRLSRSFISRVLRGERSPSPNLAREIEAATGGRVGKHDLRPDLWDAPKRRAA